MATTLDCSMHTHHQNITSSAGIVSSSSTALVEDRVSLVGTVLVCGRRRATRLLSRLSCGAGSDVESISQAIRQSCPSATVLGVARGWPLALLSSETPEGCDALLSRCVSEPGDIEETGATAGGANMVTCFAGISVQRGWLGILFAVFILVRPKVEAAGGGKVSNKRRKGKKRWGPGGTGAKMATRAIWGRAITHQSGHVPETFTSHGSTHEGWYL